jgi:hypothetical protein
MKYKLFDKLNINDRRFREKNENKNLQLAQY